MNLNHKRSHWLAATFLTLALGGTAPALAQVSSQPTDATDAGDSDGGLQEIIVTAQKRSERMQDVPIAVTALSGESLAAKGLTSTLDIAAATPGLTFTQVIGTSSPRIRGIGTGSALGGNENSVATYVDGVYYASSASSVFSLSNIAQIAVLKGPQGTLFGRNATGGLIQVTTLDPQQDFGGNVTASYGNKDTIGGSLYVTGGLATGVAADLSVYYNNQQDGFGRNLFTGSEIGKSNDLAARSKWMFDIGEATTVKVSGDYSRVRAAGPGRRLTYGSRPSISVPFAGNPFDVDSNIDAFFRSRRGGGSIELRHDFGAFDFVSLSAYRKARTHVFFDTDGTRVDNSSANNLFKERQYSQELQLISNGGGPFNWTVGAYYFDGRAGYDHVILRRPAGPSPVVGIEQIFQSYQHTKAPAVYGQATYKFTEATSLTVGLRYSSESRTLDAAGTTRTLATGVTRPSVPVAAKISVERPTWRIALDHRLNPDVLVYASYNRGFKSGGFNGAVFETAQDFRPETLDAYEIGVKSDLFGRRLRANGSAFYYDYKDIQLTTYGSVGVPTFDNASNATIYGLDFDLTARPVERLTLTAGFSYIHSRLGSFRTAQISIPLATGGNQITQGDSTGNRLPNTPDWTVDVGLDYDVPLGQGGLTFSTHYFHSDGWFAETDNRLKQKPYDLLNASVQWYMNEEKGLTLTLWGKNLTNEVYATQFQARPTGDVLSVAPGRTYGVTLGFKF